MTAAYPVHPVVRHVVQHFEHDDEDQVCVSLGVVEDGLFDELHLSVGDQLAVRLGYLFSAASDHRGRDLDDLQLDRLVLLRLEQLEVVQDRQRRAAVARSDLDDLQRLQLRVGVRVAVVHELAVDVVRYRHAVVGLEDLARSQPRVLRVPFVEHLSVVFVAEDLVEVYRVFQESQLVLVLAEVSLGSVVESVVDECRHRQRDLREASLEAVGHSAQSRGRQHLSN